MTLSRIAPALLARGGDRGRMFFIEPEDLEDFDIPDAIINLACRVRNNMNLPLADVLPTFFTEAAVELLLKTPNHFYFLSLVAYSCEGVSAGDRIGKEAVQQVKNGPFEQGEIIDNPVYFDPEFLGDYANVNGEAQSGMARIVAEA